MNADLLKKPHRLRFSLKHIVPALLLAVLLPACTQQRSMETVESGRVVARLTVTTIDNGTAAAATHVDSRWQEIDPETGLRTGRWVDAIHILPGQSNGAVALGGAFGVVAAGVHATGGVIAAERLGCGSRCGGGGASILNIVEGAVAVSGSSSTAGAVAGARAVSN